MSPTTHGDQQLATRLGELLGPRRPVAAAAVVTSRGVRVAGRGAGLDADLEIGSISKGFTGLLYADAIARGEVDPGSTLGELLPLGDVPAAAVRLDALSTHRSGLPRLPRSAQPLRRSIALWWQGTNPYGEDLPGLLDQVRDVRLGRPTAVYSNLGFELLGHALASAAHLPYADMVRERITTPLGMDHTYVPTRPEELQEGALAGTSRSGRPREPWTGEAIGPAGGIRSSITDMARLTAALLDGSCPGTAALEPVAPLGRGARIGAAWITIEVKGRSVVWHNGGTGGFRSWIGLDREASTGVVILSATSASVDRHGFALLAEHAVNHDA
ncbi:serine hydrolase domain-containing protein [Actinotalea sp. K2]|uniref:serine hydrolase domain-containing protein n=1 Tax=Actinotalea sp. K2 TaxID=2939438 RepID=UPI0020183B1D|nr:serine hydrolase domain-containing protein [Actinotalea sp. K2]MCL3861241.1 beta-lactamase family protein [Actinotalea sp. K2]